MPIVVTETAEFLSWLGKLRDGIARVCIMSRIDRLGIGNPGDVAPVGHGISEMRVHYGGGYLIYFIRRGSELILLL
jgi:putative addiction module killer protein